MKRDLFLIFIVALVGNVSLSLLVHAPNYLDDAYYYGGALRLAQGQGFTEPYVWNYLDAPTALPRPSHLYWMPLTSIVAALPMLVFGQNFFVARLPFMLMASMLPLIAYYVAQAASRLRRQALLASFIVIFSGFYPVFFATTDSFALYAFIASLTILVLARGLQTEHKGWWLLVGVGGGLAHLTRADGLLLFVVALLTAVVNRQRLLAFWQTSLLIVGYLFVTLLWFMRNFALTSSPFGAGGAATLWLVEYNDLFNYPPNVSLTRYLNAGVELILRGKVDALFTNIQTVIGVQCLIFLTPLVLIGLWKLRQQILYRLVLLYALLLYAAMTLAFSFVGARGGLFHSGVALLPFYVSAALVGLEATIEWIAVRRASWNAEQAKAVFSGALVFLAVGLTLTIITTRLRGWHDPNDHYQLLQPLLPADAVVLSNNPPLVWVAANRSGAMIPNGDETTLLAVADQFGARYVLMDRNHVSVLDRLYQEEAGQRLKLLRKWDDYKLFEVDAP